MDPESSFELIERAQSGDNEALNRLLARYRPRLRRWASGRLPRYAREITDTEDLVQDVLLRTVRNFKTFDNRGEWALQAYLRHSVTNLIRNELEKRRRRPAHEELPEQIAARDRSPLEEAVGAQLFERYERGLALLTEAEREAVIARLELGCSYQEIALLVDKPTEDAARMTVARALAKLAEIMR